MGTIEPFPGNSVFEPQDIDAMSKIFVEVCTVLRPENDRAKEVVAARIIELVRCGERNPTRLRDRLLQEAPTLSE
jgi:hypothetical protein